MDCSKVRLPKRASLLAELKNLKGNKQWYDSKSLKTAVKYEERSYSKLGDKKAILFVSHKWNGDVPDNDKSEFYKELTEVLNNATEELVFLDFLSVDSKCVSTFLTHIGAVLSSSYIHVMQFNEALYHKSTFCQIEMVAYFIVNIENVLKHLIPTDANPKENPNAKLPEYAKLVEICEASYNTSISVEDFNKMISKVYKGFKWLDKDNAESHYSRVSREILQYMSTDLYNSSNEYFCRGEDEKALLSTAASLEKSLMEFAIERALKPLKNEEQKENAKGRKLHHAYRLIEEDARINYCRVLMMIKQMFGRLADLRNAKITKT